MIRNAQEPPPERPKPAFTPGQMVKHKRYGYRGVIVEVDPQCVSVVVGLHFVPQRFTVATLQQRSPQDTPLTTPTES